MVCLRLEKEAVYARIFTFQCVCFRGVAIHMHHSPCLVIVILCLTLDVGLFDDLVCVVCLSMSGVHCITHLSTLLSQVIPPHH